MELFYFSSPAELDNFVLNAGSLALRSDSAGAEFLESWAWGEVLLQEGKDILRVGVRDKGEIMVAATLIKSPIGGGYFYWYAPRGPVINYQLKIKNYELERFLFTALKKIDGRAVFLRLEPREELRITNYELRIKKTLDLQPAKTLILDLAAGEAELFKNFHSKTRYNIRLAEKKGVEIINGSALDAAEFWRLIHATGERDKFRVHDQKHYKNLLAADPKFIKLYFARYEGKNIAAGLFSFWGDRVTYLHGASDYHFREVMAPQLLQWTVIKEAASAGYKYYDFYGINEQKWPGVTRFKLGFGGRVIDYPGTFDLIFRPGLYSLYNLLRRLKRLL